MLERQAQQVAMQSIEAKVIRKDGTVEDYGVVGYYHRNPLKRLAWHIRKMLGRSRRRANP